MTALGSVIQLAQPGFASGAEDTEGLFQFRMHNISSASNLVLHKRRRVPRNATSDVNKYLLEPGDVLFNSTNSPEGVGKSILVPALDEPAVFSNHFLRLRADPQLLDPSYLWRWLQTQHSVGVFQGMCRQWVNQATIDRARLLSMDVPLPPLEEQRRIAAILDRADAVRAKRRQVLAHLASLPSRRFDEVFAGGSWRLVPMGDLIVEQQIGLDRRSSEQGAGRAHGYLKMDAITRDGQLDLTRLTNVDASVDEASKYAIRGGDLLLNTRNSRELVGKSAVYHGPPHLYNNNLSRIRFSEQVTPQYIHGFLWSLDGRMQLEARKSGTTSVFAMYAKMFATISVPIPPIEEQIRFTNFVTAIERRQGEARRSLALDDRLFASLQYRAFRGEL